MVHFIHIQFPLFLKTLTPPRFITQIDDSCCHFYRSTVKQLQEDAFIVSLPNPPTDLHLHSWALHFLLVIDAASLFSPESHLLSAIQELSYCSISFFLSLDFLISINMLQYLHLTKHSKSTQTSLDCLKALLFLCFLQQQSLKNLTLFSLSIFSSQLI